MELIDKPKLRLNKYLIERRKLPYNEENQENTNQLKRNVVIAFKEKQWQYINGNKQKKEMLKKINKLKVSTSIR